MTTELIDKVYLKGCNRIIVIGCQGSGKTFFSSELSKKLEIECIHLDDYYWGHRWKHVDQMEWKQKHTKILELDKIIIDGLYLSSLEERVKKADVVFYLDLSMIVCIHSFLWRTVVNSFTGKYLPQKMKEDFENAWIKPVCSMRFMLRLIFEFHKNSRRVIDKILEKTDIPVVRIKKRSMVNKILSEL